MAEFYGTAGESWLVEGGDLTDAMEGAIRFMLEEDDPDAQSNVECHFLNTAIVAKSLDYDFDPGEKLWLTPLRWTRLMREYVPGLALERFIKNARGTLRGDHRVGASDNMMFRDPERFAKKHRWGGCLMGAAFVGDCEKRPEGGTITFFSRTTYIGYIGFLDAAIAYCMAWYITDGEPERIKFRWNIACAQLHSFKLIPWLLNQPDLMKKLEEYAKKELAEKGWRKRLTPGWQNAVVWYSKLLRDWERDGDPDLYLANEKYGPFKRVKKCWLMGKGLVEERRESWNVQGLTFEKANP